MKNITSLDQLLDILPDCTPGEYVRIAKRMQIPLSDFEQYAYWSSDDYKRNCIVSTEKYELILLCWEKGQDTPIHCHGGQECWVKVLTGEMAESRYLFDEDAGVMNLESFEKMEKGYISYMNDDMGFHSLANEHDGKSMSLHLYMEPIYDCQVFDEETGELVEKELEYDSLEGNVLDGVGL